MVQIERTGEMSKIREAMALFVFILVSCMFGVGVVSAHPSAIVSVSAELYDKDGFVEVRAEVTNVSSEAASITVSDAYGNSFSYSSVQSGESVATTMSTNVDVVMGYTIQVVAFTVDGQISTRGYPFGTLDLRRPSRPSTTEPPVAGYCELHSFDLAKCLGL